MSTTEETKTMPRTREEIEADRIMKTFRKDAEDINKILRRKTSFSAMSRSVSRKKK
jgi:hypothetical protein